jgi:hypothetical protein
VKLFRKIDFFKGWLPLWLLLAISVVLGYFGCLGYFGPFWFFVLFWLFRLILPVFGYFGLFLLF